jgi:hypothetical protein
MSLDSSLSNPFSTGSGGATFEQLVGASYLVTLLTGHIPRGLEWGVTQEVCFQQRWSGCLIDDVIVVSSDGVQERHLALQLKHDLDFIRSDEEMFPRVIRDCWSVFTGAFGWRFDPDIDRIGIGLGTYQTKLDAHFRPLLEWARTSKTASEFIQKVNLSKYSSTEKREYLALMRDRLKDAKGTDLTNDEIWHLLKCLVVIHFDLENAGSRDATQCWNALLDLIQSRSAAEAQVLFDTLCSIVAKNNRTAGYLDLAKVRSGIPSSIALKDQPQYAGDLNRLRGHSQKTLASISHTIGLQVHLPRTQVIDQLEASVQQKDVVVISGEPMVGKSGLLKLLATRLQLEGEVLAFSVEDFATSATLVDFLHNVNISSDIHDILSAVGNATSRCILIDGLERVTDDNKRRVLNDVLITVRQYNEALTARGGHIAYRWRVVFTCRRHETQNALVHLDTRRNLKEGTLEVVQVDALTGDELDEVVSQLPRLKELATAGHLKEILSRPLVLDILTLPDITLPPASIPSRLTEPWLLEWFWREVVRLAEQARPGRGHPDHRERLLIRLGLHALQSSVAVSSLSDVDAEALSGLVSDRLVLQLEDGLRFGHDVLQDWTLAIIIQQNVTDINAFLVPIGEPLQASRAFQLFAARLLEVKQDTSAWLALLQRLESDSALSPRWYQLAMTALLYSPLINELLPRLQNDLLENDNHLLSRLLWTLRIVVVEPDPLAYTIFGDLPHAKLEKYLAYWNRPLWKQWIPLIRFVLQNLDHLSDRGLVEFSFVARKWMETTTGRQLFRRKIGLFAMEVLRSRFLVRHPWSERQDSSLTDDEEKYIRENLVSCALQAADCLPNEVADFVRQNALRSENRDRYDFEGVILGDEYGWIPLCRHLPDLAVDILEGILCRKMQPDLFGSFHHDFLDLGISRIPGDHVPTPDKGPFKAFLRLHPEQGLELIQRMVSHATKIWVLRGEKEWNRKPLPQVLKLASGEVEIWGDAQVYYWYRYPSMGPDPVTCALMALEEWWNEQIRGSANPKELFEKVLRRTNSVAIVGVCTSVALANTNACLEAIVPIIENPAFWEMDISRFVQDLGAETRAKAFSEHFSLGNDKSDYEKLMEMARQPHRKDDIRSFIIAILLNAPQKVCERIQAALRAFPEHPPLYYEDERENKRLIQSRIDKCRTWAAFAERDNYEFTTREDGSVITIEFKLPKELEDQKQEERQHLEAQDRFYAFQDWCTGFLQDGQKRPAFNLESAMAQAQEFACLDDPSRRPRHSLEDSERRAQVVALFAAALVLRAWEWTEQNQHTAWCRDQLLIAATRPEPPSDHADEVQRFEWGYRRSAARALPVLLSKNPADVHVRKIILSLAVHHNEEVRAYLFSALHNLWETDDVFVWKCIACTERQARIRAVYNHYQYLDRNSAISVYWGRFATLKKTRARLSKIMRLLLARIRTKPLRDCIYKDISVSVLQSTLYAIPMDVTIIKWASDSNFDHLMELVRFTVNNYLHFQRKDKTYNEWAQYDWNHIFFYILANAVLRLLPHQADRLLQPIIETWEQAPSMMEELLRRLSLTGAQEELEHRLLEIWTPLGERVLSSSTVVSPRWSSLHDLREILGLLIFSDPTGIVTWKVDEWKPLRQIVGFIDEWVAKVGHDPDCFQSLVHLLKGIGFSILPEFGINWLYQCMQSGDKLFKRDSIANTLAELLHDSWLKQKQFIEQDQSRFRQFVFLVDAVADQGAQVAARLQAQLQRR